MAIERFITIDGKQYDLLEMNWKHPDWNMLTTKEKAFSYAIRRKASPSYGRAGKRRRLVICGDCSKKFYMTQSGLLIIGKHWCKMCRKKRKGKISEIEERRYELKKLSKEWSKKVGIW